MAGRNQFLEEESEKEPYIITCSACSGDMYYKGSGRYCCEKCGKEYLTDFGKIKRYLEENGPTNAIIISNETGISRRTIGNFLKEGRIEIKPGTESILYCASCGVAIRSGKYCASCEKQLAKNHGKGVYAGGNLDRLQKGEMRFNKNKAKE